MVEFREENPQFNPGLLSFALEFLLANKWPSNTLMEDYNTCDADCDTEQTEPCGCTCNTDPFEWTNDEVCLTAASFAALGGSIGAVGVGSGRGGVPVPVGMGAVLVARSFSGRRASFFASTKLDFEAFSAFVNASAYNPR